MRILICTSFGAEGVARFRADAMERLGHDVTRLDTDALMPSLPRPANWLRVRTQLGPGVGALNRALVAAAAAPPPFDVVWCDKPLYLRPATVRRLRATGARVVSFNPDNPFGRRNDPGWSLFLKALPEYSVHVLNTAESIADYLAAGARRVFAMPPFFEPSVHFPAPEEWSESDRDIDVSFIGSPYDDRPDFIRALWRDHGIRLRLWGSRWDRVLSAGECAALWSGGPAYGEAYRRLIWRSKLSLGFVTHANRDTYARRWFEVAGCGGCLLAERTADGLASFADGEEALFFTGAEDCAALIARYLPDARARARIARAGRRRATESGYDTASRMRAALQEIVAGRGC
jgi:hypothetical protein